MPTKSKGSKCVKAHDNPGTAIPIVLDVYGIPGPQGSKRHVGNGRMIESSQKVKPWREAIKWAYLEKYATLPVKPIIRGAVILEATFFFVRPKTNKNKYPQSAPDLSKLVRWTEDALTQVHAWEDDGRVVGEMTRKVWVGFLPNGLQSPGCQLVIRRAE